MLNLLTVSLHYTNLVSHLWYLTIRNGLIISFSILVLVCFIAILGIYLASAKLLTASIPFVFIFIFSLVWNGADSTMNNPNVVSCYDTEVSETNMKIARNHGYSHKSLAQVNRTVIHNREQIPREWRHNQHLYTKAHIMNSTSLSPKQYRIKQQYNHDYHEQLHHIYAQNHFDSVNSKFLNKSYISKPVWYDYL